MAMPPSAPDSGPAIPVPSPRGDAPVLELRHLQVRYPGAERPTLDGLDLTLHPGERPVSYTHLTLPTIYSV